MSFSLEILASRLGGRVQGSADLQLDDVAPLETAGPSHLSYAESRKQLSNVEKSQAGALLATEEVADALKESGRSFIIVKEPQAQFIAAMLLFRPQPERTKIGISSKAIVSPTAQLGADCNVLPGAQIGEGVKIGDRCDIGPGVIIGNGCQIGDDCIIHAHTVLYPGMILQNRVIIHANSVIGADGFGYRFANGALQKIPHTGGVIIEDDVEVGACATIDRGMIQSTVIGRGTKLDDQVMIAHNCRIGQHNAFASQVGLAGSVTTGDYVQMGGQVGIADHLHIGTGVKLGGKAGVMDNLKEPGIYHGLPALAEKDAFKYHLHLRRLPELRDQVKALTAQLKDLQEKISQLDSVDSNSKAA